MKKIFKIIVLLLIISASKADAKEVELTEEMMTYEGKEIKRENGNNWYESHYKIEKLIAEAKGFKYNKELNYFTNYYSY